MAIALIATIDIPKYFEDDLQQIFKAILEVRAPILAPALVPTPATFEVLRNKLKARFSDVYCRKPHIDCYNFCQQCEDYFATVEAIGPTQIPFITSFFRDRISFR